MKAVVDAKDLPINQAEKSESFGFWLQVQKNILPVYPEIEAVLSFPQLQNGSQFFPRSPKKLKYIFQMLYKTFTKSLASQTKFWPIP